MPPTPKDVNDSGQLVWRWVVRGGVAVALAYLLGVAIIDVNVEYVFEDDGLGPCAIRTTPVPFTVSASASGPNVAFKKVLSKMRGQCANTNVNCKDPNCPTCGRDAAIRTTKLKTRIFW